MARAKNSDRGLWELTVLECSRRGLDVRETSGWWTDRRGIRRRWDLFGFLDAVAGREGTTVGLQFTSASNMAKRVRKILEHGNTPFVLGLGWHVLVWGFRPDGTLRETEIRSDNGRIVATGDCIV